jgi:hypothetical protein
VFILQVAPVVLLAVAAGCRSSDTTTSQASPRPDQAAASTTPWWLKNQVQAATPDSYSSPLPSAAVIPGAAELAPAGSIRLLQPEPLHRPED